MIQQPMGILGGTFDPIHNGHLQIAHHILNELPITHIKFIPCYIPVHRDTPMASTANRIAMIKLAIEGIAAFSLDEREIKRQSPSFMIDTLTSLRADLPSTPLCLILGADAYTKFMSWKSWQALLDYAHLIIVSRPLSESRQHPGPWLQTKEINQAEFLTQHLAGGIFFLEMAPCLISATEIRQKIKNKQAISSLVPPKVADYIQQHALYS